MQPICVFLYARLGQSFNLYRILHLKSTFLKEKTSRNQTGIYPIRQSRWLIKSLVWQTRRWVCGWEADKKAGKEISGGLFNFTRLASWIHWGGEYQCGSVCEGDKTTADALKYFQAESIFKTISDVTPMNGRVWMRDADGLRGEK